MVKANAYNRWCSRQHSSRKPTRQLVMPTILASQECPIYKEHVFPAGLRGEMLHINTSLHSLGHKAKTGIYFKAVQ